MTDYTVRQGDQYNISFPILLDKYIILEDSISEIEIMIGNLRKLYSTKEIKFNSLTYTFDFPLTQEETYAWRPGEIIKSQVRVKLKKVTESENNFIYSYDGPKIKVIASMSNKII